jgi:hypothetical protein
VDIKENGGGLDSSGSEQVLRAGSCGHGNEPSNYTNGRAISTSVEPLSAAQQGLCSMDIPS